MRVQRDGRDVDEGDGLEASRAQPAGRRLRKWGQAEPRLLALPRRAKAKANLPLACIASPLGLVRSLAVHLRRPRRAPPLHAPHTHTHTPGPRPCSPSENNGRPRGASTSLHDPSAVSSASPPRPLCLSPPRLRPQDGSRPCCARSTRCVRLLPLSPRPVGLSPPSLLLLTPPRGSGRGHEFRQERSSRQAARLCLKGLELTSVPLACSLRSRRERAAPRRGRQRSLPRLPLELFLHLRCVRVDGHGESGVARRSNWAR